MTAIATDTGGARFDVNTNGTGLGTGILAALDGLDYDITTAIACEPLQVVLNQESFTAVEHETQVSHNAMITVPTDVDPQELPDEAPIDCAVRYTWGDVEIGTFVQQVQVVLASSTTLAGSTARRRIRAAGTVAPDHEGEQMTVDLLRKRKSGNYAVVNTKPVTLDASSAFAAKFPRPRPGRCKLTASFDGDAGHDPSSATDKLRC
jgi:hypothetical protein